LEADLRKLSHAGPVMSIGFVGKRNGAPALLRRGSLRFHYMLAYGAKMATGKCMAGIAFEITLEMLRLLKRFKCNINF
jgi:hypothetical protein